MSFTGHKLYSNALLNKYHIENEEHTIDKYLDKILSKYLDFANKNFKRIGHIKTLFTIEEHKNLIKKLFFLYFPLFYA